MTKKTDLLKQLKYAQKRALESEYWNGYSQGLSFAMMSKKQRAAVFKQKERL